MRHSSLFGSVSVPLVLIGSLLAPVSTSDAAPVSLFTNLSGPAESPPNASPGTGQATVVLDPTAHPGRWNMATARFLMIGA